MRTALIALAAAAAVATPALANEGRIEARGGVIWSGSENKGTAGVAAGYDWDLGEAAFAGVEVSGDKILTSNQRVSLGVGGRIGAKMSEGGKLYATGGWASKPCKFCEDSMYAGAGYQHNFGGNMYGKVEYRHNFVGKGIKDTNAVAAGLGVRF